MKKKKLFGGIFFYQLFTLLCILSTDSLAQEQVWTDDYSIRNNLYVVILLGCTEVIGSLWIHDHWDLGVLDSLIGLESLTTVGGNGENIRESTSIPGRTASVN
jgi:hypothetical protein